MAAKGRRPPVEQLASQANQCSLAAIVASQVRSRPEPEGSPDLKVQLRALSLLQQQLPLKALAQLCQACSGDTLVAACCRCSSRCASLTARPSAGCCSALVR
jgi:hypothetical protein